MLRRVKSVVGFTVVLIGLFSLIAQSSTIRIGAKGFTEQLIVGNLLKLLLEDRGYDVKLFTGMSTTILRQALLAGEIDLCMEYTGTGWLVHAKMTYAGESSEELYEKIKEYDKQNGIIWLDPIWCNNTYTLAVRREFAEKYGLRTISDLAQFVKQREGRVKIAVTIEFATRPDGLAALEKLYGFTFDPGYVIAALPGVHLQFLIRGDVDVGTPFGTDPQIIEYDWVVLEDDKHFWPPYDLAPCVRSEVLAAYPEIEGILKELVAAFPKEPAAARRAMAELNARVAIDGLDPEQAAHEFLVKHGLIKG